MEKINNLLENIASPLKPYAHWLLRIGLGISFFLHGYGKFPVLADGWLSTNLGFVTANLVAWGERLAGVGIILGGILSGTLGSLLTRISGGAVVVIMIGALLIAHSHWSFFFGERGQVLFTSEQIFLLFLGLYFAIKGND